MTERVRRTFAPRVSADDLVARLNGEILPTLFELRQRFNELLSPNAANAYTVTNPVVRRSFDTTTVTLPQLAEVVGTIISDLQTLKLLP